MLRFEWNGLRRGDEVAVHLPALTEVPTTPATVRSVDPHKRIDAAVSLTLVDGGRILWPARGTVHRQALDPTCWRCAMVAAPV